MSGTEFEFLKTLLANGADVIVWGVAYLIWRQKRIVDDLDRIEAFQRRIEVALAANGIEVPHHE